MLLARIIFFMGIFCLQYKNDLKNDEEIFVEKTKLIEDYRLKIKELEKERGKLVSELENYLEAEKQKKRQMFEQQLKLQKFELHEHQRAKEDKSKTYD